LISRRDGPASSGDEMKSFEIGIMKVFSMVRMISLICVLRAVEFEEIRGRRGVVRVLMVRTQLTHA